MTKLIAAAALLVTAASVAVATPSMQSAPAPSSHEGALAESIARQEGQPVLAHGRCLSSRSASCLGVWLGGGDHVRYLELGGDGLADLRIVGQRRDSGAHSSLEMEVSLPGRAPLSLRGAADFGAE